MEKLTTYTLFNLQHDPAERFDIAAQHPEIVKEIEDLVRQHQAGMVVAPSQLKKRIVSQGN